MRRGFFFSLDALLAAILLIGGILILMHISDQKEDTTQLSSSSEDLIVALSTVRVGELRSGWIAQMTENGSIRDANISVLEQVGVFWATGHHAEAQALAALLLNGSGPQGLRLTIDGQTIYEHSPAGNTTTISAARMITGVAQGEAISGSSASAYLRRIKDKRDFSIVSFGGFVGEGNMTFLMPAIPEDANVTDIIIEVSAMQPFDLIIGGSKCDRLAPAGAVLAPTRWNRTNCTGLLVPGEPARIGLNFTGDLNGSYVAGGYVKAIYKTDKFSTPQENTSEAYRFPHIDGLINLYDGLEIKGTNVSNMSVHLYFRSNYTSYLTIGNASWTFPPNETDQAVTIDDAQLRSAFTSAGMRYSDLEEATTPLRFGIGTVLITGAPSDTIIVTDTSGSMEWCTNQTEAQCFNSCGCGPCSSGGGTCGSQSCGIYSSCAAGDQKKIAAARDATKEFIDAMFSSSGPQVGLVEFGTGVKSDAPLSSDAAALKSEVDTYDAEGGTCICCGVNRAVDLLNQAGQSILIPRQASGWRYNDKDLASPPSGWTSSSYNDNTWKAGTTAIGWLYGSLGTVISSSSRYTGDYLYRKKFNVTNASDIESATLLVRSDDGAEVYINGARVDDDYPNTHSALYWNRNIMISPSLLLEGENIIAVRQWHSGSWWSAMAFDLELVASRTSSQAQDRTKNIVVMTDGQASGTCSQQGTGSPVQDAVEAACDAYQHHGIVVYTVGFGKDADASTLQAMAECAEGEYLTAANATALSEAFGLIGSTIIQQSGTQRAIIDGEVTRTILYGNSTIAASYEHAAEPPHPNEITLTLQSERLANCTSEVTLFSGSRFLEASIASYSDDYWTSSIVVNGATAYNLSSYAPAYSSLGDPHRISIPPGLLMNGNNTVRLGIGTEALNESAYCSQNNTIIYKIAINLSTERSNAVPSASGCLWEIDTGSGTINLTIPQSYPGNSTCKYTAANITYDPRDAYQLGAYLIFDRLDFMGAGKLSVNLNEEDLEVIVTTISGVPYLWGPAIARIEVTQ